MKKILLISNKVHHYRSHIYNSFSEKFRSLGFEFHVASNHFQDVDFDINYNKHVLEFGVQRYIKIIDTLKPDVVINFLHLKDTIFLPILVYCRLKKIPCIYWGHGLNLHEKKNVFKNQLFKLIHNLSSAIILYTPNETKYIAPKNQSKTFIAYNTLNFSSLTPQIIRDKNTVKSVYGIQEDFVVLYISRILPYKGLDVLLKLIPGIPEVGLVIIGPGISKEQQAQVEAAENIYYLGEKYNNEADEIFNMGDVFSTPGHIGLALNQSFFWGKPVLVLNKNHAPEIFYMKNGETGFVCRNEQELRDKIILLQKDKKLLAQMSSNAKKVAEDQMSIERMFHGFQQAIEFCVTRK